MAEGLLDRIHKFSRQCLWINWFSRPPWHVLAPPWGGRAPQFENPWYKPTVSQFQHSYWILAGTGTRRRICRSRASQTCSMGDMSGEYAGHARTGMISASRNCVQILATWVCALSCCNMRWWSWMNGTTMGLRISSRYLCAFKMPSIKYTCVRCPYHNPTTTMGHSIHNINISKPLTPLDAIHAVCYLPCTVKTGIHPWREHLSKVSDTIECEHLTTQVGYDDKLLSGSRPRSGRRACRWASLRRFLTVCAEILWLCKPIVTVAVRVAGLRWSWRWRCWMWRSWAGVVTRGLWLWGRLDCTAKFSETPLETAYGREINIKFTGNSSGGHSCSQDANCTLPQNLWHLWHCAVW